MDPLENEMTHLQKLIPNKEVLKKKEEKESVHSSLKVELPNILVGSLFLGCFYLKGESPKLMQILNANF